MNRCSKTLLALALATAAAAPAHAQLEFLRKMIPANPLAGLYAPGGGKHGEAIALVMRRDGEGNLPEALRLADALVADEQANAPGSPWLRQSAALAAKLYERSGNPARAIAMYQVALAAVPPGMGEFGAQSTFQTRLKIAGLQLQAGDAGAARQAYQSLLNSPESKTPLLRHLQSGIYAGLAKAALQLGDEADAESMLLLAIGTDGTEAAAEQNSDFAGVLATLGGARGRIDEVLQSLRAQHAMTDSNGTLVTQKEAPGILDADGPIIDLGALYYRQHKAEALQRLYAGIFSDHTARAAAKGSPFGTPSQLEKEYARFGAWFGGLHQHALASEAFAQALRLNAARLAVSAVDVAPEMLAGAFATRRQILDMALSQRLAEHADAAQWRGVLGELMQSKGLQSEFLARRSRVIGLSRDPAIKRLAAQLEELGSAGGIGQAVQRANLAMALQEKVGKLLPPLRFDDGAAFIGQLQARLGSETLVSAVRFRPFDFARQQFGPARYLGARITRDGVQVADLGAADTLDAAGGRLRADVARRPASNATAVPPSARAAYDALLKPLLGDRAAKGAYVADLDGALALLPLEALADGSGRYLIDDGEWRYVSSARMLLRTDTTALTGQAVVLADPDYGPLTAAAPIAGSALRGLHFAPLPQALEEGKAVAAALGRGGAIVTLLTGERANLPALEALHAPRYLHIATHGFYVEDAGTDRQHATGNDGQQYSTEYTLAGRSSGLALAGANATLASGAGNGVMYAATVRQLDLFGTELAVLSACDTSLGAVLPGEGVDSLRQALEVAGARTMVTSLWPVPDLETRTLMTDFYDGLATGASKPGALRQAKLHVRQRQRHPYYWAAFVVTGMR